MDIKEERKKLGMSQWQLAILSGISRDKITRIECGYAELTTKEKEIFEKCLKLPKAKKTNRRES